MWFQDLFNYDFRRTEQCIIPYATQEGEISFCAYNTGVGWRNIIEKMHMTATLTKWYEEHGRHEIIAGGKSVNLANKDHSLVLRVEDVKHAKQHDLDKLGHRQDRARRKEARPRRKAETAAGKRAHGEALSRARAEGRGRTGAGAVDADRPSPQTSRNRIPRRSRIVRRLIRQTTRGKEAARGQPRRPFYF